MQAALKGCLDWLKYIIECVYVLSLENALVRNSTEEPTKDEQLRPETRSVVPLLGIKGTGFCIVISIITS